MAKFVYVDFPHYGITTNTGLTVTYMNGHDITYNETADRYFCFANLNAGTERIASIVTNGVTTLDYEQGSSSQSTETYGVGTYSTGRNFQIQAGDDGYNLVTNGSTNIFTVWHDGTRSVRSGFYRFGGPLHIDHLVGQKYVLVDTTVGTGNTVCFIRIVETDGGNTPIVHTGVTFTASRFDAMINNGQSRIALFYERGGALYTQHFDVNGNSIIAHQGSTYLDGASDKRIQAVYNPDYSNCIVYEALTTTFYEEKIGATTWYDQTEILDMKDFQRNTLQGQDSGLYLGASLGIGDNQPNIPFQYIPDVGIAVIGRGMEYVGNSPIREAQGTVSLMSILYKDASEWKLTPPVACGNWYRGGPKMEWDNKNKQLAVQESRRGNNGARFFRIQLLDTGTGDKLTGKEDIFSYPRNILINEL
jgi:hypothetical protein